MTCASHPLRFAIVAHICTFIAPAATLAAGLATAIEASILRGNWRLAQVTRYVSQSLRIYLHLLLLLLLLRLVLLLLLRLHFSAVTGDLCKSPVTFRKCKPVNDKQSVPTLQPQFASKVNANLQQDGSVRDHNDCKIVIHGKCYHESHFPFSC